MDIKFREDWDLMTRINYLQRKIIVSSILYYEFNGSPISDYEYDELSKCLLKLMHNCEEIDKSRYWYVFKDWDGSTGYFLYYHLNEADREYLTHFAQLITKLLKT